MRVLVTGATGFVGGNVARALLARGYAVRALARDGSSTLTLDGTETEVVRGDVRDADAVTRALKGCQAVVHCAALYAFWLRDPRLIHQVNVDGTRVVLEQARRAGVERAVHCSSQAAIGVPRDGPADESTPVDPRRLAGRYQRSKYLAEQEALKVARQGLPVVIVNPTAPVGAWDVKPTRTGAVVLDYLRGRMPAYANVGMNFVDVEDVAAGHVLALEKGRPGERYILGCRNMWLGEALALLARITGRKPPRVCVPYPMIMGLAYGDAAIEGALLRRAPFIPLEGVREMRRPRFMDCSKAIRELGLPQSPIEGAFDKAVKWFIDHGYVKEHVKA